MFGEALAGEGSEVAEALEFVGEALGGLLLGALAGEGASEEFMSDGDATSNVADAAAAGAIGVGSFGAPEARGFAVAHAISGAIFGAAFRAVVSVG